MQAWPSQSYPNPNPNSNLTQNVYVLKAVSARGQAQGVLAAGKQAGGCLPAEGTSFLLEAGELPPVGRLSFDTGALPDVGTSLSLDGFLLAAEPPHIPEGGAELGAERLASDSGTLPSEGGFLSLDGPLPAVELPSPLPDGGGPLPLEAPPRVTQLPSPIGGLAALQDLAGL